MKTKYERYKTLGDKAIKDGEYLKALEYFERAVQAEPKNSEGWTKKAAVYIYLRQYADAISASDIAIKLDKKNADAWFNRGLAFDNKRKYDEALTNYDTALRYEPRHLKALNNKGTVLGQLERWDDAERCFKKVLEFDSKNADAKENLKLIADYRAGKHKRRCFIATAAYGTPFVSEIKVLRAWRDNYLLNSKLGTWSVEVYYRISPKVAEFISNSELRKSIVRAALKPSINYLSKFYKN